MALSARIRNGFSTELSTWDMALLEYLPLTKSNELRLINIRPASFGAALTLDIFHSTLHEDASVPFDALSYVWGSPADPQRVNVVMSISQHTTKTFEVSVTRNLATALQHLRRADIARTVWADAICINQRDYDERAQQVLMMGDIYRFARSVVAFLGPEMHDSTTAMNLISKIGRFVHVDFGSGHVEPSDEGKAELGWADMHKPQRLDHKHLRALFHLLHREWFERLWIRQEIGLGGDRASLSCGHDSIEWSVFCRAIFVLHRRALQDQDILDKTERNSLRDRLGIADTVSLYSKRAFRFINLRRQIGGSKCSDQRDRIYGVLGQLRDAAQIGIIPDYNKSVEDVYVDATQKHIRLSRDLSVLCQCELRKRTDGLARLPSWIPDWSTPLFSCSVHEAEPPFFNLLPAYETMDHYVLRAYGVRSAIVSKVAVSFGDSLESADDLAKAQIVRDVLSGLRDHVRNVEGDDHFIEASCRCLLLNNFVTRWLPQIPHEAPFRECMDLVGALLDTSKTLFEAIALPEASRCLDKLRAACRDRAMFFTEDGHLGTGPDSVAVGDEVCLLFGTWKPVLLRPAPQGQHRVVGGECYVHGMMNGEPILGPLPRNLRGLLNPHAVGGLKSAGFMDIDTGKISDVDVRVERFLRNLTDKGALTEPTINALKTQGAMETFSKAKISIQIFDLI